MRSEAVFLLLLPLMAACSDRSATPLPSPAATATSGRTSVPGQEWKRIGNLRGLAVGERYELSVTYSHSLRTFSAKAHVAEQVDEVVFETDRDLGGIGPDERLVIRGVFTAWLDAGTVVGGTKRTPVFSNCLVYTKTEYSALPEIAARNEAAQKEEARRQVEEREKEAAAQREADGRHAEEERRKEEDKRRLMGIPVDEGEKERAEAQSISKSSEDLDQQILVARSAVHWAKEGVERLRYLEGKADRGPLDKALEDQKKAETGLSDLLTKSLDRFRMARETAKYPEAKAACDRAIEVITKVQRDVKDEVKTGAEAK